MMEILEWKGKKIYYLDISDYVKGDLDRVKKDMGKIEGLVSQEPPKSALFITNVTNVNFNSKMTELFKEYASHNTPYAKASALVGISGLQKVILTTVKKLTGRDFYLADTFEEAREWVVKQ